MTLFTLLFQIVLTIPLTIILNYFYKKDNNALNQILIPSIYIIVISALLPEVKTNVFLIVIFEMFIRNFYVTNIVNEENINSNKTVIINNLLSIALSLFTYNYFIGEVNTVIPNPEDIKAFIWFLIIIFLYKTITAKPSKKDKVTDDTSPLNKKEYVTIQYAKYKVRYCDFVKSKNKLIENLTYAIMIYNNYKTPKLYRNINEYIGAVTKKETKYGIMQIPSYVKISDTDGIKETIKTFEKVIKNSQAKEIDILNKLLKDYSEEDKKVLINVYNIIVEFSKK